MAKHVVGLWMFMLGCVTSRAVLAAASVRYRHWALMLILYAVAVGFATIYVFRLRPTGPETMDPGTGASARDNPFGGIISDRCTRSCSPPLPRP